MDAVKFLDEKNRLCDYYNCFGCPILKECTSDTTSEKFVSAAEQWSIAHPLKTRAQDFFEKHPNAPKNIKGEPKVCAESCGYVVGLCVNDCSDCWKEPMEVEE